ncbi:uncharacterized protein LOC106425904 [Brassica napus]|uniref:uncharacterized protein LOC106425904 n=1 Tax=Brassica napus TaxID=3708 RepID=UPI00207A55E5|nr:uncharacterized protein LOC106425904 [Brassica napus]
MFRLVEPGGTPAESYRATPPPAADVEAIATDISNTRINEPCLDLSLGVGSASNIARVDLVIDVDSSSDAEDVSGYEEQATHGVIGELMRARFVGNGMGPRPNEIVQVMLGDHNMRISYWMAWRSREAEIHTENDPTIGDRFKYMFLAVGASISGFKHMCNVIIVDGAHLRGKFSGCLLTASAQDGNYQEWFFTMLLQFVPNSETLVFISDRHSSIYYGIAKVYPAAKHCACILHLKRNIRTYFKNKHLGFLEGKAARAFRLAEFYSSFNEIKTINPSCADYLISIGFEHWARSHFQGNRYNIMTSNVAESWNAVLREARDYPVLSMIEFIRSKLMTWFAERCNVINEGSGRLTPRVLQILEGNFEQSGGFFVSRINALEFDVKDKNGISSHVNLSTNSCSCFAFQLLKIPCSHAIVAAIKEKISVESLVFEVYNLEKLQSAYAEAVYPICDAAGDIELNVEGSVDMAPETR